MREWETCRRDESTLPLILFDLDRFKKFNDQQGHLVGDDCLRRVATHVAPLVRRPRDLFARYGGEEFACILPTTLINTAAHRAEVIRAAIPSLGIDHSGSKIANVVTASFGVAGLRPSGRNSIRELFERADTNLYQAKRNRKNCVVSSQDPEETTAAG